MNLFSVDHIAFTLAGYPFSYVELIGTVAGFISVYYAARGHVLTWPTGVVNEIFFFCLFYQVQLYADMFLQVYFLVVTLYGWYYWQQPHSVRPVKTLSPAYRGLYGVALIVGSLLWGYLSSHLTAWWPGYFPTPAAYPYGDGFTTMASMLATILLARKRIETWLLWIATDVVCIVLYTLKGIHLVAFEYVLFLGMASYGGWHWKRTGYA